MIKIKRVYEPAEPGDGERFLVDRLWPRGIKKENLDMKAWLKDVAPSTELRKGFHHDVPHWDEFIKRYYHELDQNPSTWEPILKAAKKGNVTLLYSAKDEQHNQAKALEEYLNHKQL
jgi:uncharacterized protein YeaO (DUF488 family)